MPSQYSRLGVVRDPRVDAALRRASRALGDQPAATLARELILRGAETLNDEDEEFRRWMKAQGLEIVRPATKSFRDPLPPLPPFDPNDPTPGTDALNEQREDRV